ncbi:MAG: hypothetical protein ABIV36_06880 [Sphingobium limneticum]
MANIAWPDELPAPLDEGGSYTPSFDNVAKTSMEAGAPKRRRRVTYVPERFVCTVLLSSTQVDRLDKFYKTDLGEISPFTWRDFRTNAPADYVFMAAPSYNRVAGSGSLNLWKASLDVMML